MTARALPAPGSLADRFDCFLLDLDGVLYRGDSPVSGAAEAVDRLRGLGKRIAFVTNNSSRTPAQVADKLAEIGIEADPEEIVTSALATASVLADWGGGRAFVVGEDGIRTALSQAGIGVEDSPDGAVDFVVVGWDRSADYAKLRTAAVLVQRGARLVATNADPSYPAPGGLLWPGAGALLAAVTTTTGTSPAAVVGKPNAPLMHLALQSAGGGRPLVVGDRLDTDIAAAEGVGWDSLLVLSGVAGPADLMRTEALPTYVGNDLGRLKGPAVRIRPAAAQDAGAIRELLDSSWLDADGVAERIPDTAVLEEEAEHALAGTVALERFDDIAHLCSLAVAPPYRGCGGGILLTARAVALARRGGARAVYLVTETAQEFFERLGFERLGGKEALPAPIVSTPMVADRCSESSVAMRLMLATPNPGLRLVAPDPSR